MKISFSIPAHNEEARIGHCLEAAQKEIARAKMEQDTEIIVVNNASSDSTKEIALSYPGVRVVDEPRKGLTFARQAGFIASTGDLVANVDADTMMPPGWLDTAMRAFEDPQLVALSGPYMYFDLSRTARFFVKIFYVIGYAAYLFNKHVLRAGAMLQGGNFVVRRDAMEKIGGFDTTIKFYGEDTDVAKRLNAVGKVVWTFRLPMYTSGRRLAKEGIVKTGMRYALNYIWTTFTGKPWSETYVDVRTDWRPLP